MIPLGFCSIDLIIVVSIRATIIAFLNGNCQPKSFFMLYQKTVNISGVLFPLFDIPKEFNLHVRSSYSKSHKT